MSFSITELPDELHSEVFKYFSFKQRVIYSRVNSQWKCILDHQWLLQKALVVTSSRKRYRMERKFVVGCPKKSHMFREADVVEVPKLRHSIGFTRIERLFMKCSNLIAIYLDVDPKFCIRCPLSSLCPKLEHISIGGNETAMDLLLSYSKPQNLHCIDFYSLWNISAWHTLKTADFHQYESKDKVIKFMSQCSKLSSLVWGDQVPSEVLETLNTKAIKHITGHVERTNCSMIEQFENLETLELVDSSLFPEKLRNLYLYQLIVTSDASDLATRTSLERFLTKYGHKVKVWKSNLSRDAENYSELTRLTLLEELAPNLEQLEITFYEPNGKLVLLDSAWQAIYRLRNLKKLKLESIHANDTNLQVILNNMKKLRVLSIRDFKTSNVEAMKVMLMEFMNKHPKRAITFKLGPRSFTGETRVEIFFGKD
ncbi:hypothetical protein HDE_09283 [Halotydeus destructor]|nr:hypothetical protein HDE_09283 [Halotydeus destructor]